MGNRMRHRLNHAVTAASGCSCRRLLAVIAGSGRRNLGLARGAVSFWQALRLRERHRHQDNGGVGIRSRCNMQQAAGAFVSACSVIPHELRRLADSRLDLREPGTTFLSSWGNSGRSAMVRLIHGVATLLLAVSIATTVHASEPVVPVVWKVSLWGERRVFTEHLEELARLVREASRGKFRLDLRYGSSLSKGRDNLAGIANGEFEMAQVCVGDTPDQLHAVRVLELPFFNNSADLNQVSKVSTAVYRAEAVQKEFASYGAYPFMPSPLPQFYVVGTGDAPTSLEGFEQLSVRALGNIGAAVEATGAEAVYAPFSVLSQVLDRHLINAVSLAPHTLVDTGIIDESDWWTKDLNPGTINCPVVVSISALEELEKKHPDWCKILRDSRELSLDAYIESYNRLLTDWDKEFGRKEISLKFLQPINGVRSKTWESSVYAWYENALDRGLDDGEISEIYKYVTDVNEGKSSSVLASELEPTPCIDSDKTN